MLHIRGIDVPVSSKNGKQYIREYLTGLNPSQVEVVVDVGVGCGTYSDLYRPLFPNAEWVGVEAWAPYVSQYNLKDKYKRIMVADVSIAVKAIVKADIVFMGDVLEHLPLDQAKEVVGRFKEIANHLIISVPIGACPQGAVGGNTFESHLTYWNKAVIAKELGEPGLYTEVPNGTEDNWGRIGVAIYRKGLQNRDG